MRKRWAVTVATLTAAATAVSGLAAPLPSYAVDAAVAGDVGKRCEKSADPTRQRSAHGRRLMVAAANPAAVKAGCVVLASGGTAADAAVAVQAVLGVVEPQSSGLGGGSLITYYDQRSRKVRVFDGLSAAPAAVTKSLQVPTAEEQKKYGVKTFGSAVNITGRAIGVPGTPRVLDQLHGQYGRLKWSSLFGDAIGLADNGFALSPFLRAMLLDTSDNQPGCFFPDQRKRYCDGDQPKPIGTKIKNPDLAGLLRDVAAGGADAFYDPRGPIAPAIVERARRGPFKPKHDTSGPAVIPSLMTTADFAAYRSVARDPLCTNALSHRFCTAPPPDSGGLTLLYMLELAERGTIGKLTNGSDAYAHLSLEASRLAAADIAKYVGDPAYGSIPTSGLLNERYLNSRFALFSPDRAVHPVQPGTPPGAGQPARAAVAGGQRDATSNITIADAYGNVATMTTTVNLLFGSHLEARGLALNDVQSNFDQIEPAAKTTPNGMESRKRPRTSIAPTLVQDRLGHVRLAVGAAGGGPIPDYVFQTALGVLLHRLDPQRSMNQPHVSGQGSAADCGGVKDATSLVEKGTKAENLLPGLKKRQHPCASAATLMSGLSSISLDPIKGLSGGADIRRDGVAMGL